MKKVYVLWFSNYDDSCILGIFEGLEKAEKIVKELENKYQDVDPAHFVLKPYILDKLVNTENIY